MEKDYWNAQKEYGFADLFQVFKRVVADKSDPGRKTKSHVPLGGYVPRADLAIAASVAYSLLAFAFWLQLFAQGRPWMFYLILGTTGMAAAFITRALLHQEPENLQLYLASTLLNYISVGPSLFFATNYEALSHIAEYVGREDVAYYCLPVPANVLSKVLFSSDLFSVMFEAAGAIIIAQAGSDPSSAERGQQLSLVGTIFQAVTFLSFTLILVTFGLRVSTWYPEKWNASNLQPPQGYDGSSWLSPSKTAPIRNWRILYYCVLLTCLPFLARSGYRIFEFWQYHNQPFRDNEVDLYKFDTLPLFLGISVYLFAWPPRFLKTPEIFRRNSSYGQA
ncbi:MAG: hypothetical protein CYPHOPRED_002305 [Cyphobasidiales sp. Tagirdzhanova-0007]|nr:MAG: hypothetical protein CYPHOPRED_002305 [Cyphobasidiales sp. Tagirdzhanova-0007]